MSDALTADCTQCAALCCVAPAFEPSSDFAIRKPAGRPCPNLDGFGCAIHGTLRTAGFSGCVSFDCLGAGQQVTQGVFEGTDWRRRPDLARQMFDVFGVVRTLHELLWYLTEALDLPEAASLHPALEEALHRTRALTTGSPTEVLAVDLRGVHAEVNALLQRTSEQVRATLPGPRADHRGADLVGRDLQGADLRGANLRGAWLMGADLRRATLSRADLTGADLRGAGLHGADLCTALFLRPSQLSAAVGDADTRLPDNRERPAHWPA